MFVTQTLSHSSDKLKETHKSPPLQDADADASAGTDSGELSKRNDQNNGNLFKLFNLPCHVCLQ